MINRIEAWTIGVRNTLHGLLIGLLEPTERIRVAELEGDFTIRLAMQEATKTFPVGAVWDEYCRRNEVPSGLDWLGEIKAQEQPALSQRV